MKQTVEEAAKENILFNHRTVDRTLIGKDLAKFGEINFVQGAEWQSKQSPWINVKERLPENNTVVLTRGAYGFLICRLSSLGEWETGANVNKERLGITHWMPIPSLKEYSKPTGMYLNGLKRKEINMEVKNGIIIDGVLHESSEGFCNECSLSRECSNLLDDNYCALLDLGIGQCFVSRGKVTDIKTEKEEQSCVIQ